MTWLDRLNSSLSHMFVHTYTYMNEHTHTHEEKEIPFKVSIF